jgi:hypothetical protein
MPRCRHCSFFLQTNKEYKKILNRYAYSPDKSGQVVIKVAGWYQVLHTYNNSY